MSLQNAAREQEENDPTAVIDRRKEDFFKVLPKHIDQVAWLRMAKSAVRKNPDLVDAAKRNPTSLCLALMDCARLGHMPGTDEFYLVPRRGGIDGDEGWKGIVDRILNSGAYSKIVCEVVYSNEQFEFDPNEDEKPRHKIDHFKRGAESEPVMAYAYAIGLDGKPSYVAVADPRYIKKVKAMSKGGVWGKWDEQMYKKTAIKLLVDYVETSSDSRHRAEVAAGVVDSAVHAAQEFNAQAEREFERNMSDQSDTTKEEN